MPAGNLLETLTTGFGSITASIGLVIVFGTVIGVALEESGAAALIAHRLVKAFGPKRIILAMGCIGGFRSEEHTSELQSLMRNSYAVFCLKKKKNTNKTTTPTRIKQDN